MISYEVLEPHLRILGLGQEATHESIKEAYRRAARANHPDLFPDAERPGREIAMMRINEAYVSLLASLTPAPAEGGGPSRNLNPRGAAPAPAGPRPAERRVGPLKNPDYVYYKRGLENYREGQRRFFDRRNAAGRPQHYLPDARLLELAAAALRRFRTAYSYFYRVVSDYPDSIWVTDSRFRLWRLEQYNRVYIRICRRLAERVLGETPGEEQPQS